MKPCRLHITGASGTGTTTLARVVANVWSVPHADTDDYFWVPSTPAYIRKRSVPDRLRLMREIFVDREAWVLSGSLMGWGDPLVEYFDAVVFLSLEHEARMTRLRLREATRYGPSIEAGGTREDDYRVFMEWAGGYEDPEFDGRNRVRHELWLNALQCPVLRLESNHTVDELAAEIVGADSE